MPRLLRRILPLACLAGLALPAAPAAASACANASAVPRAMSASAAKHVTLCLLNQERADHGLRPLRENARLERAARGHSYDMVAGHFFSHSSRSGSGSTARIRRSGYLGGARGWVVGENIGWGGSTLASPATMVRMWMRSPGHRANVLRSAFRDIGIGIVVGTPSDGGDGATYTTDFGRRG